MTSSSLRIGTMAAIAGTILLAFGTTAGDAATAMDAGLVVRGVAITANAVKVDVVNTTPAPVSGTVRVRAVLLGGATVELQAHAAVGGGSQACVWLPLPEPAQQAVVVGVVLDDGAPF